MKNEIKQQPLEQWEWVPNRVMIPNEDGRREWETVCILPVYDLLTENDKVQARGKLIAAAPSMLAALKTLVEHAQETHPHFESERGQRDIAAALAAIAQAEGRQ